MQTLLAASSGAIVMMLTSAACAQGWQRVPDEVVARTVEHYPETNERAHEVYFPLVAGRGGGFLGVGSAQSYSIAAAQSAERIVLIDYDPVVTRIHRALDVLIAHCDDAGCLSGRLSPAAEDASANLIRAAVGDGWAGQRIVRGFRVHRPLLARRIHELSQSESWVSREDWYAHIRDLARADRITARVADLRGDQTLPAIGEVARAEGLEFRVIYLSNAEEYFSYGAQFTRNLSTLPHDPSTLVLRTFRDRRLPRNSADSMWHYDSQPLDDLLTRIRSRSYENSSWLVADLLASRTSWREDGTSVLDETVPSRAQPANRRWWLSPPPAPPQRTRRRRPSRVLLTVRRAMLPTLDRVRRDRLRAVDLTETGLAHLRDRALPPNPRTAAAFVLSGESAETAHRVVPEPERNLEAMLFDGMVREILPELYDRAGRAQIAARLRRTPAANDLYAAYRLRERLLEICPPGTRARGRLGEAVRACRHASRSIRPAPTARARPDWAERQARIARATRGIAGEAARSERGAELMVGMFVRLTAIARAIR